MKVNKAAKGVPHKSQSKSKKWNTMSHLVLKRFQDDDPSLTNGAKRDRAKHPHVAIVEMDPSGRSTCKLCGDKIPKNTLRFGLMLECHKGYRNLCTLHEDCFWKHKETKKLVFDDLCFKADLSETTQATIRKQFEERL